MIKVDRSILVRSMRDKAFQTVGIPFTKTNFLVYFLFLRLIFQRNEDIVNFPFFLFFFFFLNATYIYIYTYTYIYTCVYIYIYFFTISGSRVTFQEERSLICFNRSYSIVFFSNSLMHSRFR